MSVATHLRSMLCPELLINKTFRIIYLLWSLAVATLILVMDPFLFSLAHTKKSQGHWNSIHFNEPPAESAANNQLTMYRGNAKRNAAFNVRNLDKLTTNWKTQRINFGIHSASKASVISDADSIYVGSDTSWFYSFNRLTGKINWKIYLAESSRGIHSTAAVDGDSVYVGSYRGAVYRINKKTGEIIWMRLLGDTAGASPLITSQHILFNIETTQPNGYLIKLNKANGSTVWQSEYLGEQSHSSPALSEDQKTVTIGVNNSTLQGFDFENGQRKWTTKITGPSKSTVWIHKDNGFITSWGKELLKFSTADGKIIWNLPLATKSQVSPAYSEKYNVLMAASSDGQIYGVDADLGRIKWKSSEKKFSNQISSPVLIRLSQNDERFLFVCEVKKLCLIHPQNGKILRTWDIDGYFTGSIYLYENNVYLAMNNGQVISYEFR